EQKDQIQKLRNDWNKKMIQIDADKKVAQIELQELIKAEASVRNIESKMNEISKFDNQVKVGGIQVQREIKALMTEEQWKRFNRQTVLRNRAGTNRLGPVVDRLRGVQRGNRAGVGRGGRGRGARGGVGVQQPGRGFRGGAALMQRGRRGGAGTGIQMQGLQRNNQVQQGVRGGRRGAIGQVQQGVRGMGRGLQNSNGAQLRQMFQGRGLQMRNGIGRIIRRTPEVIKG
ncbi:hypothetical protein ACFL7D_10340, partial [candidate division KSB1 bacterium]